MICQSHFGLEEHAGYFLHLVPTRLHFQNYLELLRELNDKPSIFTTLPGVISWVFVMSTGSSFMGRKHNLLSDVFVLKM